jgi:flagellar hook-associated protein 2
VITVAAGDTLSSIAQKINQAKVGISASTLDTGASINSAHLSLQSQTSGYAGAMIIDDGGLLGMTATTQGQDAVMQVGGPQGFVLTSATNTFTNAVSGLTVQVLNIGTQPAEVQVTHDPSAIRNAMTSFVSSYNAFITNIASATKFDPATSAAGPLQGNATALRSLHQMQSVVNNLYGSGTSHIRSLLDLGVSVNSDGTLALDSGELQVQLDANPQDVSDFFSKATTGFGAVLTNSINGLTDTTDGALALESSSDQSTIDGLTSQISQLNGRLTSQQNDLFNKFYNMETTLSQLQGQQRILNQFQGITTTSTSSSKKSS